MDLKREKNKSERRRKVSESETIRKASSIVKKYHTKYRAAQNIKFIFWYRCYQRKVIEFGKIGVKI